LKLIFYFTVQTYHAKWRLKRTGEGKVEGFKV
jgi:hypothetical protein